MSVFLTITEIAFENVSSEYVTNSRVSKWKTHIKLTNVLFYNLYILIFYIAPTYFGVVVSPYSGSWHQHLFKVYNNKICYNKRTYVVV